jgi:hypothetical protein
MIKVSISKKKLHVIKIVGIEIGGKNSGSGTF